MLVLVGYKYRYAPAKYQYFNLKKKNVFESLQIKDFQCCYIKDPRGGTYHINEANMSERFTRMKKLSHRKRGT